MTTEKEKAKQQTKLDSIAEKTRRGSYLIVQARMGCHYMSIQSVLKTRRYYNEDIVKMLEQVNKLSDEDFAVELVRAKKRLKTEKENQTTNK